MARAKAAPAAPFLVAPASAELAYAPAGFSHSYGEVLRSLEAMRQSLAAAGYGCGTRVALLLENRPEFFWPWLALNGLGVSILPINPDLRADDLAYQFRSRSRISRSRLPETHALIAKAWENGARIIAPGEIAARLPRERDASRRPSADDPCALLFTSGTTAKPKCCVLSNDYFLRLANWYVNQGGEAAMGENEIVLTPLPLFHNNALCCSVTGMILKGGTVVPLDRFSARRWWRIVTDSRRDRDPLSRRDAGDPAAARERGGRDARTACASASARTSTHAIRTMFEARFELSADRGLGDDRNRRRRRHDDGRRAAPCRQALHRPHGCAS